MIRKHVYITGQVQGVFFRACTRAKAVELLLSGWVRNLPDGRVEAVFEGPEQSVQAAIDWCRTEGSASSRVDSVEVIDERPEDEVGFEILH